MLLFFYLFTLHKGVMCINMKIFSILIFEQMLHQYFALHCVFGELKEMSMKLMDNVLAENYIFQCSFGFLLFFI